MGFSEVLQNLEANQGKTYGTGECYSLASWYSIECGGPGLGAGYRGPEPNGKGNTQNASDIWYSYDWPAGWSTAPGGTGNVKRGAIFCVKPGVGGSWQTLVPYGHVGIIDKVDGNTVTVIDQNTFYFGRVAHARQVALDQFSEQYISGFIYPSGAGSGSNSGPTAGVSGSSKNIAGYLLEITNQKDTYQKTFFIPNLYEECMSAFRSQMVYDDEKLGWDDDFLNSDFFDVELVNSYGDSVSYDIQNFNYRNYHTINIEEYTTYDKGKHDSISDKERSERNTKCLSDPNGDESTNTDTHNNYKRIKPWEVVMSGSLGDHADCRIYIKNYGGKHGSYDMLNVKSASSFDIVSLENSVQEAGRNLTILNDSLADYLQSNKNQINAQRKSFRESNKMIKKQNALNSRKVDLANEKALYSSDYALDVAKFNQDAGNVKSGVKTGSGILSNLLGGNILGAVGSGISNGVDWYYGNKQNKMSVDNAEELYGFTKDQNKLNKQAVNLSNMQAKLHQTQTIRAYNAALKDAANSPDSIQQLGDEFGFVASSRFTDVYIKIRVIPLPAIKRLLKFTKLNGVPVNRRIQPDFPEYKEFKGPFKYMKFTSFRITNSSINKMLLASLEAIFQSGVRVFNYDKVKNWDNVFDLEKVSKTVNSYYLNSHWYLPNGELAESDKWQKWVEDTLTANENIADEKERKKQIDRRSYINYDTKDGHKKDGWMSETYRADIVRKGNPLYKTPKEQKDFDNKYNDDGSKKEDK